MLSLGGTKSGRSLAVRTNLRKVRVRRKGCPRAGGAFVTALFVVDRGGKTILASVTGREDDNQRYAHGPTVILPECFPVNDTIH